MQSVAKIQIGCDMNGTLDILIRQFEAAASLPISPRGGGTARLNEAITALDEANGFDISYAGYEYHGHWFRYSTEEEQAFLEDFKRRSGLKDI